MARTDRKYPRCGATNSGIHRRNDSGSVPGGSDRKTIDAVVRNIEIIGEAARHVPPEIERASADVAWPQMRGMRNVMIHEYDTFDVDIVWQTIQEDLPSIVEPLDRLWAGDENDGSK